MNTVSIGVDIGGTKVNIGVIDADGHVLDSHRLEVVESGNATELIRQVCEIVEKLWTSNGYSRRHIQSVGVGVPGTVEVSSGVVEYCPNLGWEDIPAGKIFKSFLGRDVIISQDSRAAAWAEYLLGAGKGSKSMVCITIGTGIGSGIILDGKIFHGAMNTAGELGHTIYKRDGYPCNCGLQGCFERYCSGTGIFERAYLACPELFVGLDHKAETVFELAKNGNREMQAILHDVVIDLAIGIANTVSILSPELVVISGGLCEQDELIIQPLREQIYKYGYHSWARKKQLQIVKAELGSTAPMIGAALLYKDR